MKNLITTIICSLFFFACTNTKVLYKKELAEAVNHESIEVYKSEDGNLKFFLQDSKKKYQFLSQLSKENKGFYDVSYIEKSKDLDKSGKKITILNSKVWEDTQKKVFEKIVPKEPFKAVLFLIYYYEMAVYRDASGTLCYTDMSSLPEGIEIIKKYDNKNFVEATFDILKENIQTDEEVLIYTSTLEKNQMPFIYLDTKNNRLISLYNSYTDSENYENISYLLVKNAIGLINNPVTVLGRLFYYLYNSAYVLAAQNIKIPDTPIPPLNSGEEMNIEDFLPKAQKIAHKKISKGNLDFLIDGEAFFYDFTENIKKAQEEILIRTYIFDNDDYAVKIADMLKEKSKTIKVKVLMDEIGSMTAAITNPQTPMPIDFNPPKRIDKYLEHDSKVKTRTAKNPWFTTDHNKVMIFDKTTAYIGGMNIGKEYRYEWHDMMLKVKGPIINVLANDFWGAWAHSGWGGDLAYGLQLMKNVKGYGEVANSNDIDILPVYTKTGKTEILKITLEAIKNSKKEILIENAYFSDDQIVQELINARARGVNVKVLLPYWGNHNIMNSNNMVKANILMASGIKVYLYPKMNHVKASIFDGFAMVGTANYDKLSMRVNQEINFCFWDKNTVEKLKSKLFETDFKDSMLLSGEFPILWGDYLLEKLAKHL